LRPVTNDSRPIKINDQIILLCETKMKSEPFNLKSTDNIYYSVKMCMLYSLET